MMVAFSDPPAFRFVSLFSQQILNYQCNVKKKTQPRKKKNKTKEEEKKTWLFAKS